MKYSIEQVKEVFKAKGYKFFERGDYNLNIIGVREDDIFDNAFSDTLLVFWKEDGQWKETSMPWTTMPGTVGGVLDPITVMGITGTAVLKENQYRGCWQFIDSFTNFHQSPCLWQVGELEVYRDGNRDFVFDRNMPLQKSENFGINIHAMGDGYRINNWSLGCQGTGWFDFARLVGLLQASAKIWGHIFSYTLLHANDFEVKAKQQLKKVEA